MASEFNSERQTILRKVTDKKERLRNTTRKEEGKENEKDRTRKTRVRGVGKKGKYGEIMKLKTLLALASSNYTINNSRNNNDNYYCYYYNYCYC